MADEKTGRVGVSAARRVPLSAGRRRLVAALLLALAGIAAIGVAGAHPATAAAPKTAHTTSPSPTPTPSPTPSPSPSATPGFVAGRHIYDYGQVLSATSAAADEAMATAIEAAGGGRVVVYTALDNSTMPDSAQLAESWGIDGMLLTGTPDYGTLVVGATLKAKLTKGQSSAVDTSSGMQTSASWIGSDLARVSAFVGQTHVFDGTGVLDAAGRQKAENAAVTLAGKLGAPVYIDIALGGDDPSNAAFFNGAHLSSYLDNALVIALGVSGTQIAGYLQTDNSDLWDKYSADSPWKSTTFDAQPAQGGDVQSALLAAIGAVHKGSAFGGGMSSGDVVPIVVFVVVIVIFSITVPFLVGPWLMRKLSGTTGPIKNGLPGSAVIQEIADTGITVTMSGVGPEAPDYKLTLLVTPSYGSSAPYTVVTKALIPRIFVPMIVPGQTVGVLIDPTDPQKVSVDFSRIGAGATGDAAGAGDAAAAGAGGVPLGGMSFNFDANGQPAAGDVAAVIGAVGAGTMPIIKGRAAHLLATGTHGTAVITTAMPMGKTVRDINPTADPARLNDPMWLFTVEVSLAGEKPFPAVFGHRVPIDKLAAVMPGAKLAVAVDMANKSQDVAIDWDKSPIV
jgi:hypothetical protein